MHIPDGYLGPATWLALFALMLPFWALAFRNANRNLGPRNIPMISFMAALSFILMMFNLPVPDGTTAHIVGAAIIAIVLGPYAATIALTVALLIQALLFGDGGITAFGANVFNMGVVMPFTAIFVYIAARKILSDSTRSRMIAGFLAGYLGLVVAAFCAAVEFGIQPIIAPGYCPYGLNVAIPAMVLTHLLVGVVEGAATSAVVYYLAEYRPELLNLKKLAPKWMEKSLKEKRADERSGDNGRTPVPAAGVD